MVAYKVNKQVFLGGRIIGVGVYDESRIRAEAIPFIKEYCDKQKTLSLDEKDIPPYFEIIDTDKKVAETVDEKLGQQLESYIGMGKKKLLELAKQRGLKASNKMSEKELIALLTENDKKDIEEAQQSKFLFKSGDEFSSMDTSAQVDYLDSIFSMPDDVEENSDEETEYINTMVEAVTTYGGLSLEQEAVDKIKEILDWANADD